MRCICHTTDKLKTLFPERSEKLRTDPQESPEKPATPTLTDLTKPKCPRRTRRSSIKTCLGINSVRHARRCRSEATPKRI